MRTKVLGIKLRELKRILKFVTVTWVQRSERRTVWNVNDGLFSLKGSNSWIYVCLCAAWRREGYYRCDLCALFHLVVKSISASHFQDRKLNTPSSPGWITPISFLQFFEIKFLLDINNNKLVGDSTLNSVWCNSKNEYELWQVWQADSRWTCFRGGPRPAYCRIYKLKD